MGELIGVATSEKNGLVDKKYSHYNQLSDISTPLIRLCGISKNGFTGRISLLFGRNEESITQSLFNIYVTSYKTIDKDATIKIVRVNGNHNNIKFYRDGLYLYAYCNEAYHVFSIHAEEIFYSSPSFMKISNTDISNMTEIPIN